MFKYAYMFNGNEAGLWCSLALWDPTRFDGEGGVMFGTDVSVNAYARGPEGWVVEVNFGSCQLPIDVQEARGQLIVDACALARFLERGLNDGNDTPMLPELIGPALQKRFGKRRTRVDFARLYEEA